MTFSEKRGGGIGEESALFNYNKKLKDDGVRYGKSYTDFDKMLNYYNLSKLPDYDNATEPYIAYILMSRPSINLDRNNMIALQNDSRTAAFMNDQYGKLLMWQLSNNSANVWLPLVTTKAMSYSVNDISLKTLDKGSTYFGHSIKYGKHTEDHKISGSMTIEFRNDRFLSMLKTAHLWSMYYNIISKGQSVVPIDLHQKTGILDYAASLYYLVTRRDGRELVYWEKVTGMFPTNVPFSMFSSNDSMIMEERFNVEFAYGMRSDPCDPSVLMDINFLSGYMYNTIQTKTQHGLGSDEAFLNNHETPFVKGDVFANFPFIKMEKTNNGALRYMLTWRKA